MSAFADSLARGLAEIPAPVPWILAALAWVGLVVLLLSVFGGNARLRGQRDDDLAQMLRNHHTDGAARMRVADAMAAQRLDATREELEAANRELIRHLARADGDVHGFSGRAAECGVLDAYEHTDATARHTDMEALR